MTAQENQATESRPRTSGAARVGLALCWLLLVVYAAWLIHNALPWLGGASELTQKPTLPALIAQVIALPVTPSLAAPLSPVVAAAMLFLLIITLTLSVVPSPARSAMPSRPDVAEPAAETSAAREETPAVADTAPALAVAEAPQAESTPAAAVVVAPVALAEADGTIEMAVAASAEPEGGASTPQGERQERATPTGQRLSVNSHRVFISSTAVDLAAHRQRVHDALERMYQVPVDMAQFGAGGADATTVSYTELATAEIVVLIVAWRYGFIPKGETRSITHLEYLEAKRRGLPVYVYLADPATEADDGPDALFPAETRNPEHAAQLAAFRALLSDSNANTIATFDTPADLSEKVVTALARRLLRGSGAAGRHTLIEARALDRKNFKLGDDNAATFAYQTAPLQAAWDEATQALLDASAGVGGKRGIVALGEANAGKTRLALETLMQALPEWPVLRWDTSFTSADLPPAGSLPVSGAALFVDDLQTYATLAQRGPDERMTAQAVNTSAATLRALVESITVPLVIVATCRSEDEARAHAELSWLIDKLAPVRLPQFSEKTEDPEAQRIMAEFAAHGSTREEDWDGTLGSLVLGLSTRRALYEDLVKQRSPAADVLRAMKLLTEAEVYAHTERRLRAVCADVFHAFALGQDARLWEEAYGELLRLQFVRIADDAESGDDASDDAEGIALVIRKDAYFDSRKVMTDYPNPHDPRQLARHLAALLAVFVAKEDFDGLFSLGGAFYSRAEYDKALAAYDRALALRPEDAATWYNRGVALGELGRWEEALAAFDQALALRPDHADTWYNRGVALGQLGRWEGALAAFERALALRPEYSDTWYNRGVALRQLGRTEEALAAYDRALALRPEHAANWVNRGVVLGQLGHWEEALATYDFALTLNPDDISAWIGRGYVLLGIKRYDEAVASIDEALRLEPENADWWDGRGEILLWAGRAEEALTAYDEALRRAPGLVSSCEGKAQALRALGRDAEADALDCAGGAGEG